MLHRLAQRIEFVANIAIILVACLLALAIGRAYFFSPQAQQPSQGQQIVATESRIGNETSRLSVDLSSVDIDWKTSAQTVVLAISTTCHFCTESAPFYKRLISNKGDVRVIAVLPQSAEEGHAYLNRLGVVVDEIKQISLHKIGVRGTPTLILVDSSGVASNSWIGKLPADQELIVLTALQGT
jgi:thioredoxin-related protein